MFKIFMEEICARLLDSKLSTIDITKYTKFNK